MVSWEFDTGLDPDWPVHTRGNAGEVLPDVVSPFYASVLRPHAERAWRREWVERLPVIDDPPFPATFFPIVGGRFYLNLSVLRKAADLAPGTSPEEIDHQFFATGFELPPYERDDDPRFEERARVVEEETVRLVSAPPSAELYQEQERARAIRREGQAFRAGAPSPAELWTRVRSLLPVVEDLTWRHLEISGGSSVAFGGLQQGLRQVYGEEGDELARRVVSGLGDVESAAPPARLAELARLSGDDEASREAMARFLDDYGFRGVNEWEPAAPSWEMAPEQVERMVEAARAAEPKPDPRRLSEEAVARITADGVGERWPELPFFLAAAQFFVSARERTKSTAIMVVNELRLDLWEIGRRLLERPEDVYLMSGPEIEGLVAGKGAPLDAAAERFRLTEELRTRQEPVVLIAGQVPPVESWPRRGGVGAPPPAAELRGVAGSPGAARGRARVVLDPYRDDPPRAGEVLVAPVTDPGWTPMFTAAVAVVTERGGELSHAVIVARELGIPAVVAAAGCLAAIRTGDLVEVDGSAGVVRVVDRKGGE